MVRSVISVYTKMRNGQRRPTFLTQLIWYSSALQSVISRYAKRRFPTFLATDRTSSRFVHFIWSSCSYLQDVRQYVIKRYAEWGFSSEYSKEDSSHHLHATASLLSVEDKWCPPTAMYSEHRSRYRWNGEERESASTAKWTSILRCPSYSLMTATLT